MLETSQLEGLWLEVLLDGEKKRFSNDPQLTRGLVLIFFIGRDYKEAKLSSRVL